MISCVDEFGGNVLYYVVKGGNFDILEYFIDKYGLDIKFLILDDRIILYIVCIYKNVEICYYVVNYFLKEFLNVRIKDFGLIVVYYIGVELKGDGSEMIFLEIFCNSEMDFFVFLYRGLFVLDRVVDYLNVDLIWVMVGK